VKTFHRAAILITVAAIAMAALWWKCRRDPTINFLPSDARADWIIFPAPVEGKAYRTAMMDTTFQRQFQLTGQPKFARVQLRAAKRVELKINGKTVDIGAIANWKSIAATDVLGLLRSGTNTVEARVFNDDAPPALWFLLSTDALELHSDSSWGASIAGSAWHHVALASQPRRPGPGNLLAGGETTLEVLPKIWRTWALLGIAALGVSVVARQLVRFQSRKSGLVVTEFSRWQLIGLLGITATAWLILFANNATRLPFPSGYDKMEHLNYISYIQERRALPLPNEGWEMFQPPLYYALSASVLWACRLTLSSPPYVVVLRALTMCFGVTHFVLALLCLRLLFPGRIGPQLSGLLLAAFLPMQLYLSHYITNETLAGTLVTATIYFALRVLKKESASIWDYVAIGSLAGFAMLAKTTSLLLLPPLFGALMINLVRQRSSPVTWLRTVGTAVAICLLVCGWYYMRIWWHFGTPIVGNWEPASGFHWWQDPGFHVAADYFRFGQSLINPLFSGFNGFADGIYSTLWGDGLCGGFAGLQSRTPWNYELMIGNYLISILPTVLIAGGVSVTVYRFLRRPSPEWFLLLGFSTAVAIGLIFMTLRVASYAQIKAFYGLSALVPVCAFVAVAWEKIELTPRFLRWTFGTLLLFWAFNSFASVWIPNSARYHIHAAFTFISAGQSDRALSEAVDAVKNEPTNATAKWLLGAILDERGEWHNAVEQAKEGIQLDAGNPDCRFLLAITLGKHGETENAILEGRRALELAPENPRVYDLLASCARQLQRTEDAIAILRDAIAISPFDSDLHYRLGLAAGEVGDFQTAAPQFAYALLLQPNHAEIESKLHLAVAFAAKSANAAEQLMAIASSAPDSPVLLNKLAWIFATHPDAGVRNGLEAVRLSKRACALTNSTTGTSDVAAAAGLFRSAVELSLSAAGPATGNTRPVAGNTNANCLATLAAAYAEAGKFSEAITTIRKALSLSQSSSDDATVTLCQDLLTSFQANRPYRQEPR
jgi:Flp pilus assembly protein TadD